MEFGVAAFGVAVSIAASKLCAVMSGKLERYPKIKANVQFIRDELEEIKDTAERDDPSREDTIKIAQLRRLAYDIEDCIDCFDAGKMSIDHFAQEIVELKSRSTETRDRFKTADGEAAPRTEQGHGTAYYVPNRLRGLGGYKLNCLLYLGLFPRDRHVRTKPLIRRWTAEGLVREEQEAVSNLGKLIESSIIEPTLTSNNGRVKRCQLDDIEIINYILQRPRSENFILSQDGVAQLSEKDLRRLSVRASANVQLNFPRNLSKIRTVAVFATGSANLVSYEAVLDFAKYKVLRVLDLKECDHLSNGHIQAICDLVLMKYLSINLGSICRISRDIGRLNQLETLDLSGSQIVTVYKEVLMLPKLKHLLGKLRLSEFDTTLWGTLASDLERFLNKSVLETLTGFVTGRQVGFPQMMSLMRRLRKVKIWCQPDASQENLGVLSSAITDFIGDGVGAPDLKLSLSIDFEGCLREFVDEISVVMGKLDSLKLRGNLSQLPPFVAELSALEELCLWSTGLSWEFIRDGLRFVGGLKYLKLIEDKLGYIEIWYNDFISIERLSIVCNKPIDMTVQDGALPYLVSLHIVCPYLLALPGRTPGIKIAHMTRLNEVALHPGVRVGIKAKWNLALDGHTNRPVLLSIEGPDQ